MGLLSPYAMMGMAGGAQKGLQSFLDEESKTRLEEARLAAQEAMQIRAEGRKVAAVDAERTNQTKRIGDKVSSYKDEALKQVMADAAKDGAPGDAPTSYEEMASDPAYAPFLKERGLLDSGRLRERAGIETGDISPEKAATLEEARLRNEEAVNERKQSRQDLKDYRDANLDLQRDKFDARKVGGTGKAEDPELKADAKKLPIWKQMIINDPEGAAKSGLTDKVRILEKKLGILSSPKASQIRVVRGENGDVVIRDDGQGNVERLDTDALPTHGSSASAGGDKWSVGSVYKDQKGNRAKYLGNGKWQSL